VSIIDSLAADIGRIEPVGHYGRVLAINGLAVEVTGPVDRMQIGSRVIIETPRARTIECEVVGFRAAHAVAMPFARLDGVGPGARTTIAARGERIFPHDSWLGRVVDAMGEPIDGLGPLKPGGHPYDLRSPAPPAHARRRVGPPLDLGIRAINTFVTCCRGQRMGIFAGSGIGKSILFSMLARNTTSDVSVIGLIGERGREVQEFIADSLGPEGLAKSIIVVATSDEAALMRRQAGYLTMTLAEYFRDRGKDVLCLIDSITRFAVAQREIGLASGEPPTTRGYTPTVFSELPALLERAGPGVDTGSITGLFTVLVEGDDHNEPVADAVRAILDGHIVMDRAIAERGRFPAINVLRSVSRTMPGCLNAEQRGLITEARRIMGAYADMEEIIRLGAYRRGSDALIDRAIELNPDFEGFLGQEKTEFTSIGDGYTELARIVNSGAGVSMSEVGRVE
jgi:flagellum-specific ATP synthase